MQYKYHTKSGSLYIRTVDAYGDTWDKIDKDGNLTPLAGAMHITRRRLQEIITDYPLIILNRTALLGKSIAKDFFEDVRREGIVHIPKNEESLIFFLIEKEDGKYSVGYSSRVERVEILEQQEKTEGTKIRF